MNTFDNKPSADIQTEDKIDSTISEQHTYEVNSLIHDPKQWWNFGFFWQFFVLSLTWVLFGYDVGIVGSLIGLPYFIIHFQGPPDPGAPYVAFTAKNVNLTVTVAIVGSLVAPLIGSFLQNRLGRKKTVSIAFGLFCLPSSFLQLFAPNIDALAVGRFFNFAGVTLAETTILPYLVDIVPAKYRGLSIALSGAFNGVTQVIATAIMYACSQIDSDMQWKIPLAIQIALPFALLCLSFTLYESTSWLLKNGRVEEATNIQTKIRRKGRDDLVEAEIASMLAAIQVERELKSQARFFDLFNKENRMRTLAASLIAPMTACSGLGLTTTYGVVILQAAGVADPFKWAVGTAVLSMAGIIIGGFVNDYVGRRPLVIIGLIVIALFDFAAGGIAFTGLTTPSQGTALASVSIVLSFFCQVGFAGIYALMSEIPKVTLREYTISYTIFMSLSATIISSVSLPYILGAPSMLGPKAYLICGGFMVVGSFLAYFILPETKNRTYGEIDLMYTEKVPAWKTRSFDSSRAITTAAAATADVAAANASDKAQA